MADNTWDVTVIGGGAAGLSAALMLGRARRRVLVVDSGSPRNRFSTHLHGVLGNEGADPAELVRRGRAEVAGYGVDFREGAVAKLDETERGVRVTLAGADEITARAAIVASGLSDELPDIPGLASRWGAQVLHCPYCHGWEVRDQRLGVLTSSPFGLHQGELVRQWSEQVTVFTAGLGALDAHVEHRLRARGMALVPAAVVEIADGADGALLVRTDDGAEHLLEAVFTTGTPRPHDGFLEHLGLDRAQTPFGTFLAVDEMTRTSSPRIWAAGNVVDPGANVPMSIGAGTLAGGAVNAALVGWDVEDAVAAYRPDIAPAGFVAPADFWEHRYASTDRAWSGRPNQALVQVAEALTPGRALDLGCGEGADAIWLADHGWEVTGIDISPTAIRRATETARAVGIAADRLRFEAGDLSTMDSAQGYDLVTASFFQSPVKLPRADILRSAAARVAPRGHLLLISHVAPPPGAHVADGPVHSFPTPAEEIDSLGLDPAAWTVILAETRGRQAPGPDGQVATLSDGVVLLRRY